MWTMPCLLLQINQVNLVQQCFQRLGTRIRREPDAAHTILPTAREKSERLEGGVDGSKTDLQDVILSHGKVLDHVPIHEQADSEFRLQCRQTDMMWEVNHLETASVVMLKMAFLTRAVIGHVGVLSIETFTARPET